MLIKFIVFTIGLDIIVININYIILYLILFLIGYNFFNYVYFIISNILYLIIGIFIIIISFKLPKGEYNDI